MLAYKYEFIRVRIFCIIHYKSPGLGGDARNGKECSDS